MEAQTYLLTYRADQARRARDVERRRQNESRLVQPPRRRRLARKNLWNGVAALRSH